MRLSSLLALCLLLSATELPGQTVSRATELLNAPDGRGVATIRAGGPVRTGTARGGATAVTLEGWVHRTLIGGRVDTFAVSVRAPNGAMLRAEANPNAQVIAELRDRMGVQRIGERGDWVRVRRTGWVSSGTVVAARRQERAPAQAAARPSAAPPAARQQAQQQAPARAAAAQPARTAAAQPARTTASQPARAAESQPARASARAESSRIVQQNGAIARDTDVVAVARPAADMESARRTVLATGPGGDSIAMLAAAARVTTLGRDRGWVRVRIEGWVRESDLAPARDAEQGIRSAAELRGDPEGTRGRTVRWTVQKISVQNADPLRREMRPDEPYMLARGPGSENALLYLALPPSMVETVRALPALAAVEVVAIVRVARSEPAGIPILDVQSLTRR